MGGDQGLLAHSEEAPGRGVPPAATGRGRGYGAMASWLRGDETRCRGYGNGYPRWRIVGLGRPEPEVGQFPATVIRAILMVGEATELRHSRSLPIISIPHSMSFRFPAIVTSSTGWVSSPFSIQIPTAPRE